MEKRAEKKREKGKVQIKNRKRKKNHENQDQYDGRIVDNYILHGKKLGGTAAASDVLTISDCI